MENSKSQHNIGSDAELSYTTKWREIPLEEQLSLVKKQMDDILDYDKIMEYVIPMMPVLKMLKQQFNKASCEKFFSLISSGVKNNTFFFTNLGKYEVPKNLNTHIKDVVVYANPMKGETNFHLKSTNTHANLIMEANRENKELITRIYEKITGLGIKCILTAGEIMEFDILDASCFPDK